MHGKGRGVVDGEMNEFVKAGDRGSARYGE